MCLLSFWAVCNLHPKPKLCRKCASIWDQPVTWLLPYTVIKPKMFFSNFYARWQQYQQAILFCNWFVLKARLALKIRSRKKNRQLRTISLILLTFRILKEKGVKSTAELQNGLQTLLHLPAIVAFCQGRKNITRPSEVLGSNRPMFAGLTHKQ